MGFEIRKLVSEFRPDFKTKKDEINKAESKYRKLRSTVKNENGHDRFGANTGGFKEEKLSSKAQELHFEIESIFDNNLRETRRYEFKFPSKKKEETLEKIDDLLDQLRKDRYKLKTLKALYLIVLILLMGTVSIIFGKYLPA